MASYYLTKKAIEDISKIWEYTFEIWSEHQAETYYLLLINTCQTIANNPMNGKHYTELGDDIFGIRVGKHIIFYRNISSIEIHVLRVLHERMDLKNKIG